MEFAVPVSTVPVLPVAGADAVFPVHRIFCVGRNYAEHAREMGCDPDRDPPFFFMKPACAAVPVMGPGTTVAYPPMTSNYQHEIELVVAIGTGGANIPVDQALQHVFGYGIGLDMTRRDLQLAARDKGRPWEFGKAFAQSAPIGPLHRVADIGHPAHAAITVSVNNEVRQASNIDQLIWSVAEAISCLSAYEALVPGDLIMTGTPAGVGPVGRGDVMRGAIDGLGEIVVRVAP
jgi:fumarylpyruvate hydrolase